MVWPSWQQLKRPPGSWSSTQGSSCALLCPGSLGKTWHLRERFLGVGRSNGLGALGEEGAWPACHWPWAAPPAPLTVQDHPSKALHFPCVLGKSETGTEVLRKDKGGGRGRWPGFRACHKGRLSGRKNLGRRAHLPCACASEEPATAGEVSLGPPGSPSLWGRRWQHQGEGTSH